MERFFNFKNVDLVRIGTGAARIAQVTAPQLHYVNGRHLQIDRQAKADVAPGTNHAVQM
jgi:hypothetical protein